MGDYAFEGVTNILGGAVRIGGTINPTTEFDLGEGGTLDISGKNQTIAGLEGYEGAAVVIGGSELTVNQAGNTAFGGDITSVEALPAVGVAIYREEHLRFDLGEAVGHRTGTEIGGTA